MITMLNRKEVVKDAKDCVWVIFLALFRTTI